MSDLAATDTSQQPLPLTAEIRKAILERVGSYHTPIGMSHTNEIQRYEATCKALEADLDEWKRRSVADTMDWVETNHRLAADLAQLREDKERLDWLNINGHNVRPDVAVDAGWNMQGEHDEHDGWAVGDGEDARWFHSLRQAIDFAARSGAGGPATQQEK